MNKLQKYPKYKDSGVEWIGEIPEHWNLLPTKRIHKVKKELNTQKIYSNVLSLTLRGVVNNNIDNPAGLVPKDYATYQFFKKNDLVFKLIDLENISTSRVGIVHEDGIMSSAYIRLCLNKNTNNKYMYYYFYNLYLNQVYNNLGSGVRSTLGPNDLLNIPCLIPPHDEQIQIANYLDKKTAQIDKLISIKEKLIKRLKEQRQIIINNAVTKGLNPNVKMKDSGIEWIGEIPKHWEVRKFRFYFDMTKGLNITKADLKNYGIPCINYGEIHSKYPFEVIPEINNLKCVNETYLQTSSQSLLNKGDFVFADTSEDIEGSGNFTYLNSDTNIFAGYHTIIARLKSKLLYRFFAYYFDSLAYRKYIRKNVKGVKVYSITNAILKESKLLIPPQEEQIQIAEHLDKKTAKIDKAIKLQEEQIEKLKEYKTTLIDSVVTGKVRVVK